MILAAPPLTAARAADYYRTEFTRGDYAATDRALMAGTWQGRGAERLGLTGGAAVRREEFVALLHGRSPVDNLKALANKRDVPYQSLLKVFLAERIDEELRKLR
jgi:conjugative relaxase-like TrwC/TraI family protein